VPASTAIAGRAGNDDSLESAKIKWGEFVDIEKEYTLVNEYLIPLTGIEKAMEGRSM
jgi:hypothetical protein